MSLKKRYEITMEVLAQFLNAHVDAVEDGIDTDMTVEQVIDFYESFITMLSCQRAASAIENEYKRL